MKATLTDRQRHGIAQSIVFVIICAYYGTLVTIAKYIFLGVVAVVTRKKVPINLPSRFIWSCSLCGIAFGFLWGLHKLFGDLSEES